MATIKRRDYPSTPGTPSTHGSSIKSNSGSGSSPVNVSKPPTNTSTPIRQGLTKRGDSFRDLPPPFSPITANSTDKRFDSFTFPPQSPGSNRSDTSSKSAHMNFSDSGSFNSTQSAHMNFSDSGSLNSTQSAHMNFSDSGSLNSTQSAHMNFSDSGSFNSTQSAHMNFSDSGSRNYSKSGSLNLTDSNHFENAPNVYQLNKEVFDQSVLDNDVSLVLFHNTSKSCAGAKQDNAARDTFIKASNITTRCKHSYAAVDCGTDDELCKREKVKYTPVLRLYSKGRHAGNANKNADPKMLKLIVETLPVP